MVRILRPFIAVAFLLLCSSANATAIGFGPFLGFGIAFLSVDGGNETVRLPLSIANLSIVSAGSSTRSTGNGRASADLSGWRVAGGPEIGGSISVSLGEGPGSATASILNISTFDLLFPKPGQYYIEPYPGVSGDLIVNEGDSGFASWELFLLSSAFDFGESQVHVCEANPCSDFFDDNKGLFLVDIDRSLRLPFEATVRFDIGVSRVAAVPEPSTLLFVVGCLFWIVFCAGARKPISELAAGNMQTP